MSRSVTLAGTTFCMIVLVLLATSCDSLSFTSSARDASTPSPTEAPYFTPVPYPTDMPSPTPTPYPTPYPSYTESDSPSGTTFSGTAQQVILSAQLASQVDSQNQPVLLQTVFQSNQTIYLSYDWARGYTGYVQTRWWLNGRLLRTTWSSYISQYAAGFGDNTMSFYATGAMAQGTVEVFWCQDSACRYGGLAWARPFSIFPE